MTDLTAFLRARIDEDHAGATTAERNYSPSNDVVGPLVGFSLRLPAVGPWLIIDPARVLAEVQARRAILDLHAPLIHPDFNGHPIHPTCRSCSYLDDFDDRASVQWPCPTILALAAVFADHPDFRSEWRPTT